MTESIDFRSYIREVPDFPKPGILFKDISPLLASPPAFAAAIEAFATHWGRVDNVAALDARGFVLGGALALALEVPLTLVRKKGKLPGSCIEIAYELEYGSAVFELQNDAIAPGNHVLVVDDLLATGGTARAACRLIEQQGGVVAGCAFFIELDELNGRDVLAGYAIQSLVRM
jgi:adenine phosphoribosyltransferase